MTGRPNEAQHEVRLDSFSWAPAPGLHEVGWRGAFGSIWTVQTHSPSAPKAPFQLGLVMLDELTGQTVKWFGAAYSIPVWVPEQEPPPGVDAPARDRARERCLRVAHLRLCVEARRLARLSRRESLVPAQLQLDRDLVGAAHEALMQARAPDPQIELDDCANEAEPDAGGILRCSIHEEGDPDCEL